MLDMPFSQAGTSPARHNQDVGSRVLKTTASNNLHKAPLLLNMNFHYQMLTLRSFQNVYN